MLIIFLALVSATIADPASEQLIEFKRKTGCPIGYMRTSSGAPVNYEDTTTLNSPLNTNELFLEELAHFVRERIPPKVVHTHGVAAFGYFEVTHNVTDICKAKLFDGIGKQTPVAVRFSLATKDIGAPDVLRDSRGLAVKFYTEEGNFDIVGLNSPMFAIKDPLYFPSFIRATKKNTETHLTDRTSFWDIVTSRPESAFFVMYLFSDYGTPAGFVHMPGFSIHTYQVYNKFGESHLARFKIIPNAGIKNFGAEEAVKIGCYNPEYASREIYNSIEKGDFPSWTVSMQVLSTEDAKTCNVDPFDVTQTIPDDKYPWRPVGILVLNENPKNSYADVEQIAFNVANLVPGILGAPDKIFEARRFTYRDAQNYRLGVNFNKIEVNLPLRPVFSYIRDGVAPVGDNGGNSPNYFPNSYNGPVPSIEKNRPRLVSVRNYTTNNYDQAADMYNGMSENDRRSMTTNIVNSLVNVVDKLLLQRIVELFTSIHPDMGYKIKTGLANINKF